jgi:cathepsin F
MKAILIAILFIAAVSAGTLQNNVKSFHSFISTYDRTYSDFEYSYRFGVFVENMKRAAQLQAQETGSAIYGVTKFSDLTPEEFAANYLMPKSLRANITRSARTINVPEIDAPTSFDWRDKGAISAVKNQEQCGSCWAFSATETIESYHHIAHGSLPILSPQQIVDCDKTSYGCNGGWTEHAFNYVKSAGGLDTAVSYPYTARDGTCKFNRNTIGAKITGWKYVTQSDDENLMLSDLQSIGPFSVCVDASSWSSYRHGVIQNCGQQVDHCVQLTGFSTQDGIKAWNVRNSWGTDWGVNGYLYVARGHDTCAIGSDVNYVTE